MARNSSSREQPTNALAAHMRAPDMICLSETGFELRRIEKSGNSDKTMFVVAKRVATSACASIGTRACRVVSGEPCGTAQAAKRGAGKSGVTSRVAQPHSSLDAERQCTGIFGLPA